MGSLSHTTVDLRSCPTASADVNGLVVSCASCHAMEDLVPVDPDGEVYFCRDCATPASALEFPEFYLDLGGGN